MKSAIAARIALSLCLLTLDGAGVAAAAEPIPDGQEQARKLLSGTRFSTSDAAPRSIADTASAGVLDPQEQAREMILGRHPKADSPKARLAEKAQ